MLKRLKKLSEEVLHQNPWWIYKHDTYEKPNGEIGDYYYPESPGFVMIVPLLQNGNFLLVNQFKYLQGQEELAFPGGGMTLGTEPLENAQRELMEETGAQGTTWTYLDFFEPSSGFIKDRGHIFFTKVEFSQKPEPDDTEEFEFLELSAQEIDEYIKDGKIWFAQTMAAWCLAKLSLDKSSLLTKQENSIE